MQAPASPKAKPTAKAKAKAAAKKKNGDGEVVNTEAAKRFSSFMQHQKTKSEPLTPEGSSKAEAVKELAQAYKEATSVAEKNKILKLFDEDVKRQLKWVASLKETSSTTEGTSSSSLSGTVAWCKLQLSFVLFCFTCCFVTLNVL